MRHAPIKLTGQGDRLPHPKGGRADAPTFLTACVKCGTISPYTTEGGSALDDALRNELLSRLRQIAGRKAVSTDAPMSRYTTLGLGGPAEVLCEVTGAQALSAILRTAAALAVPVTVLGNGSNVLVRDGGIPGLTLRFGESFADIGAPSPLPDGRVAVTAQAGALLVKLANAAADASLTGLEFAAGIPGTVGGALVMNAGAYGGEIKDTAYSVACMTMAGETVHYTNAEMAFGYRRSRLADPLNPPEIALSATFALRPGDADLIRVAMREYNARRREKQPLTLPCCGSTFKRPPGGFAGTLIEQSGLKGLRVGGASVSTLHAGFLVNDEGGTARDYLALISEVQRLVKDRTDVWLEPEVRILGVDASEPEPEP